MNRPSLGAVLALCLAQACASPDAGDAAGGRTLASVPGDVERRDRVDFGGAVELLGWDVEPKTSAPPGSTVRLRLYLRSTKRLSAGWRLFAELRDPHAENAVGEARGGTGSPSDWLPGTIYLEEREITVPEDVTARALSLVAGFTRDPVQVEGAEIEGLSSLRLPVLSGLSDGADRAILATLQTGVRPGDKRAAKPPRRKADDRKPPGDRSPRPALSALRRALPQMPAAPAAQEKP